MLAKLVSLLTSMWRRPSKASQKQELLKKKRAQQAARARNYINPWHNI